MRAGIFALTLIAAGPAMAYQDVDGSAGKLPAEARSKLTEQLDTLYDPDAAKVRKLVISRKGHVCGLINGKSLAGAYTGYRFFHFALNAATTSISALPEAPPISPYQFETDKALCEPN